MCARVSATFAILLLEILEQSRNFANLQEIQASYMCNSRRGAPGRTKMLLHASHHYVLQAKIILVDFNSALSTLTAKPRQV